MPRTAFDPISAFRDVADIKSHPAYAEAKRGDPAAAMAVALGRMPDALLKGAVQSIGPGAWFVPAFSKERGGHNAIPVAMANVLASVTGGQVWTEVVQVTHAYHTGADPMERLVSRPTFEGGAPGDGPCIIVDDVTTMGGTLAELADHLLVNGAASVNGSVLLANASRSGTIHPSPRFVGRLNHRLGEAIRHEFHIEPAALTADEAQYLIGFRSAAELSGRADKARAEIDRRRLCKPSERGSDEAVERRERMSLALR